MTTRSSDSSRGRASRTLPVVMLAVLEMLSLAGTVACGSGKKTGSDAGDSSAAAPSVAGAVDAAPPAPLAATVTPSAPPPPPSPAPVETASLPTRDRPNGSVCDTSARCHSLRCIRQGTSGKNVCKACQSAKDCEEPFRHVSCASGVCRSTLLDKGEACAAASNCKSDRCEPSGHKKICR